MAVEVIIVDDEAKVCDTLVKMLQKKNISACGFQDVNEALHAVKELNPAAVVSDIKMPQMDGVEFLNKVKEEAPETSLVLMTGYPSVETCLSAIRMGTLDYLLKPVGMDELYNIVKKAIASKKIYADSKKSKRLLNAKYKVKNLVGKSKCMMELKSLIKKASKTDSTALIIGESGAGKEVVARMIHFLSKRKDHPFVSVSCAAVPETLLESEFFGHEKGAFTDAFAQKIGLLEFANGGTFFMDEVGEMPQHLQSKLLRAIQERTLQRIGGLEEIPFNVRFMAATSRNLYEDVQEGKFRRDFYYRINVFPVFVPPLRERKEDIRLLVNHYVKEMQERLHLDGKVRFSEEAIRVFEQHDWPGNVRELENVVERLANLVDNDVVSAKDAKRMMGSPLRSERKEEIGGVTDESESVNLTQKLESFEKRLIEEALEESKGNKYQAAKRLNISPQSLNYKLKKYGLD